MRPEVMDSEPYRCASQEIVAQLSIFKSLFLLLKRVISICVSYQSVVGSIPTRPTILLKNNKFLASPRRKPKLFPHRSGASRDSCRLCDESVFDVLARPGPTALTLRNGFLHFCEKLLKFRFADIRYLVGQEPHAHRIKVGDKRRRFTLLEFSLRPFRVGWNFHKRVVSCTRLSIEATGDFSVIRHVSGLLCVLPEWHRPHTELSRRQLA